MFVQFHISAALIASGGSAPSEPIASAREFDICAVVAAPPGSPLMLRHIHGGIS
jgi:hypothetical protein